MQLNGRYVQVCARGYVQPAEGMCRNTARYVHCAVRRRTPKTMNGGMCRYVRRVCAGMCDRGHDRCDGHSHHNLGRAGRTHQLTPPSNHSRTYPITHIDPHIPAHTLHILPFTCTYPPHTRTYPRTYPLAHTRTYPCTYPSCTYPVFVDFGVKFTSARYSAGIYS